jgi:hypothetical protein
MTGEYAQDPDSGLMRIEIKRPHDKKPFQIITENLGNGFFSYTGTADINFDGYQDLMFFVGRGCNGFARNETYMYYVYDPKTGLFKKLYEAIMNPIPNPTEKKIYSYHSTKWSEPEGDIGTYQWDDTTLQYTEAYTFELLDIPYMNERDRNFRRIHCTYEKNKMKTCDTAIVVYRNMRKRHRAFIDWWN